MSSDLRWKFILIAIIILLCIFGVVGLPEFPTSAKQLKQNLADRIKLGLDLKGGSHLVLQVQVDEAIGQRCDETIDALTNITRRRTMAPPLGLWSTACSARASSTSGSG